MDGSKQSWHLVPRLLLIVLVLTMLTNAVEAQVPSIDSLAGKWLSGDEIVNPPSVTNTVGALGCTENLTGFRYCMFPPIAQGGEAAIFHLNGKPIQAHSFKWSPHQVERSVLTSNGLELISTTRLADNQAVVLIRLQVKNVSAAPVTAKFELKHPAGFRRCEGTWDWNNRNVNPKDSFEHETQTRDELIHDTKTGIVTRISRFPFEPITVRPGSIRVFEITCSFNNTRLEPFPKMFSDSKTAWEKRWEDAFTPGNKRYSGHFPTLVSNNPKLNRMYYMALMTLLQMERTSFKHSKRCFVTVGPQYGTTLEYFWDTALFSTLYSLLDPRGFKENLTKWLDVDIHSHYAIDYLTGQGVGPWYAPNDYSLFTAFWNYATTTGDVNFLEAHKVRMLEWANAWKARVSPGEQLADWGENDNILECGPEYIHMIPSLNGAHVGTMRKVAQLFPGEAGASILTDAYRLSEAVMKQYVNGSGVWMTKHRDGSIAVSRHVYDYLTIGMNMAESLTPAMKTEMTEFVHRELMADGWIRAMSLSDLAAPISDRPDHGPKGSYCAWPALAALTMAKFGQYFDMENMIEHCEAASWQGPFPQAFELIQEPITGNWIPRIALRGADYNETSGAAFAETVIKGLFGLEFDIHGNVSIVDSAAPRPVMAQLLNVKTKDGLRDFHCGFVGVR